MESTLAGKIVFSIMSELDDRAGFDEWFDSIAYEDQLQLTADLRELVQKVIDTNDYVHPAHYNHAVLDET